MLDMTLDFSKDDSLVRKQISFVTFASFLKIYAGY
jgi:hypothetical protein